MDLPDLWGAGVHACYLACASTGEKKSLWPAYFKPNTKTVQILEGDTLTTLSQRCRMAPSWATGMWHGRSSKNDHSAELNEQFPFLAADMRETNSPSGQFSMSSATGWQGSLKKWKNTASLVRTCTKFSLPQRISLRFKQIIGSEGFKKLPQALKRLDPAPSAVNMF